MFIFTKNISNNFFKLLKGSHNFQRGLKFRISASKLTSEARRPPRAKCLQFTQRNWIVIAPNQTKGLLGALVVCKDGESYEK